MPSVSTAFRVLYTDVEPSDPEWLFAPLSAKTEFKRLVVQACLEEKDQELAAGKDRFGFNLAPITRYTRAHRRSAMGPADPAAPPLTPAHELSRTRANLDGRAMPDYAEFFWRGGWGPILGYHRAGAPNRWAKSGRLPVRDVIGISPAALTRVKRKVAAWWSGWKASWRAAQKAKDTSSPFPMPRTRPAPQPTRNPVPPPVAASPARPGPGRTSAPAPALPSAKPGSVLTRTARRIGQTLSNVLSRLFGK